MVAYTLLCGYEPFFGNDDQELISANKNVDFEFHMPEWGHISDEAKDWICRALLPVAGTWQPSVLSTLFLPLLSPFNLFFF